MKFGLAVFFAIMSHCVDAQKSQLYRAFMLNATVLSKDTGILVLWYPDTLGKWVRDTAYLQGGKCHFSGFIGEPALVHVIGSEREGDRVSVFLGSGMQTLSLEAGNFSKAKMHGSVAQSEFDSLNRILEQIVERHRSDYEAYERVNKEFKAQVNDRVKKMMEKEVQQLYEKLPLSALKEAKLQFVREHPNSFVSPYELSTLIAFLPLQTSEMLFFSLSSPVRSSRTGKLCLDAINRKRNVQVSEMAPHFQALEINGKPISLNQFRGKYVLLDFWASWCIPCRKEVPKLKRMYRQYHLRGLEIIGVSVDKDMAAWKKAVSQDRSTLWSHVLANEEIRKGYYNLDFPLPTKLLIDPDGKIIWNSNEDQSKIKWEEIVIEKLGSVNGINS